MFVFFFSEIGIFWISALDESCCILMTIMTRFVCFVLGHADQQSYVLYPALKSVPLQKMESRMFIVTGKVLVLG